MVAAVAAAAAVTSPSPAAAAAAGGDQTTQLLLPSIHKIMEEDKLKELNGGKTPPPLDTPALDVADIGVASTAAAKKLGPLVDYDSDSDEESSTSEEESSSTSALPPAKRLKTASGGAPAV